MRFVVAFICFALAIVAIGLGVAERTFLAGPTQVSATSVSAVDAPVVVIDGSALNAYPHTQTLALSETPENFAAYGRTNDVLAWIGKSSYRLVSFDAKTGKLVSRLHTGSEQSVPNPAGSDLWLDEFSGPGARNFSIDVPQDYSVIAVSNGRSPAPRSVTISWPLDNSTPFAGYLIFGGAGMLLIGLILLLWAFTHLRRTRGPRRNVPRMPRLPRQPRYKPARRAIGSTSKGRRSIGRSIAFVPVIGATILALSGCGVLPTGSAPTPTSTAKVAQTSNLQQPAVTPNQLQDILQRVSALVARADTNKSARLLRSRLDGPALEDRLANYAARTADSTITPSPSIPSGPVELTLPQASDVWPRTVFAVVQSKSTVAPLALMLVQQSPRANYKVTYSIPLQPKVVLPQVAPASIGATRMSPDIKLLQIQPSALALAYGDILLRDTASPSFARFQEQGDSLRKQVGLAAKKAEQASIPTTAALTYTDAKGDGPVIAMATNNSGAIVAVNLDEIKTIKPVKTGAAVSWTGDLKALSGKATSLTGLQGVYGDQLLFYVPRADKPGKIVLLGYATGPIQASEVP